MAKYRVETEKGTFEIETADQTGPDLGELQAEDKPLEEITNPAEIPGKALHAADIGVKRIGTGIGNLVQTRNMASAASDADAIQAGQSPATVGGKIGNAAANFVTPSSIGAMALTAPILKVAGEGVSAAADALGYGKPGAKELAAAIQQKAALPAKYAQKGQMLEDLSSQAGKEIEAAQAAKGIGMSATGIPEAPRDLNEFANSMRELARKSPEELSQAMDLKGLQQLKDTITVTRQSGNLSGAQAAFVNKAADKIDSAIAQQAPEIGQGLSKFRDVADAQEALKNDQIVEKMKLTNTINKIRNDMRMSPATKVAKITSLIAKYGAGGAGLAFGIKKFH